MITVYDRLCLSRRCVLKWTGESECIYRSLGKVSAGYELGWEYVDMVNTSKQTFQGFVTIMNNRYKSRGPESLPFMTLPTFIDWWFGWASNMRIDFREICNWCENGPEMLACDGTKVGLGLTNAFVKPIESLEDSNIIPTRLRRNDRCYIVTPPRTEPKIYAMARTHLRYVSLMILGRICSADKLAEDILLARTNQLKELLPAESLDLFKRMLCSDTSLAERQKMSWHFKELSHDCSLDTIIPLFTTNRLLKFVADCKVQKLSTLNCLSFANTFYDINRGVADLIGVSVKSHGLPPNDILDHLHYLASFVINMHNSDVPPEPPKVIESSYNPPKLGRAFYFERHGMQVRNVRTFSIDVSNKKKENNFDDKPLDLCTKVFPQVSKKGMTYLFLWFCPRHGHCYGFHIIPGSEGRKDPAAAIYTHMETPPKCIFYDHACSLSEYVKNRESGFFKNTRVFHDVFHGFTHKCSTSLSCADLNCFAQVNTSVCEQFNSYIQRIKSSAKLLSQVHFVFYLQFFIHQRNQSQFKSFEKRYRNRKLGNMSRHPDQNYGLY